MYSPIWPGSTKVLGSGHCGTSSSWNLASQPQRPVHPSEAVSCPWLVPEMHWLPDIEISLGGPRSLHEGATKTIFFLGFVKRHSRTCSHCCQSLELRIPGDIPGNSLAILGVLEFFWNPGRPAEHWVGECPPLRRRSFLAAHTRVAAISTSLSSMLSS